MNLKNNYKFTRYKLKNIKIKFMIYNKIQNYKQRKIKFHLRIMKN